MCSLRYLLKSAILEQARRKGGLYIKRNAKLWRRQRRRFCEIKRRGNKLWTDLSGQLRGAPVQRPELAACACEGEQKGVSVGL